MDGGVNVGCGSAMISRVKPRIAFVQSHEIEVQLFFRLIHHHPVVWGIAIDDEIDAIPSIDSAPDSCDWYPVVPASVFCGAIA